jgi:hypothetical protein
VRVVHEAPNTSDLLPQRTARAQTTQPWRFGTTGSTMGTKGRTHRSLTAWWPTEGGVSQAGSRITLRFDRGKGKKELLPKQSGNCRLRFYDLIKLSSGQQTLDVFWSKLSSGQQTLDVFWSKLSSGQ